MIRWVAKLSIQPWLEAIHEPALSSATENNLEAAPTLIEVMAWLLPI